MPDSGSPSAPADPTPIATVAAIANDVKATISDISAIEGLLNSSRSVVIEVDNATNQAFTLTASGHSHGGFAATPAVSIGPASSTVFGSQSEGFLTGCEGTATYTLGDGTQLFIHWDNPYTGGNSGDGHLTGPHQDKYYLYSLMGSGDQNAQARYALLSIPEQDGWRYCQKCAALYYDGFVDFKGSCPAGGAHDKGNSLDFSLVYAFPIQGQSEWCYCKKCSDLYYNGFPAFKGVCHAGGMHEQTESFNFVIPNNLTSCTGQNNWRYCAKCSAMFYNGFSFKGVCPAGGGHDPGQSVDFCLKST